MKRNKLFVLLSCCTFVLLSSVSFAYATYVRTPSNVGINISGGTTKHTITYYLPKSGTNEFEFNTMQVDEGSNLYTSLSSVTGDIDAFSFDAWHQSKNHFRTDDALYDVISSSSLVNSDVTVYAKYVQDNALYYYDNGDVYVTSSQSEYIIPTNTIYTGTRIFSLSGVEGTQRTLKTPSGKYGLVKNAADWYITRYFKVNVGNISWWYTHEGNKTYTDIYYFASGLESHWITNVTFTDNSFEFFVNESYTGFIICRKSKSGASWDNVITQTVNIYTGEKGKGSVTYSKDHITMYVEEDWVDSKLNYSWW